MGNTDCDALARYIIAEEMYIKFSERLSDSMNKSELPGDIDDLDGEKFIQAYETIKTATEAVDFYASKQDKYFKQCRAAANDLGLSISSRCRLVIPKAAGKPPENKFNRFKSPQNETSQAG